MMMMMIFLLVNGYSKDDCYNYGNDGNDHGNMYKGVIVKGGIFNAVVIMKK